MARLPGIGPKAAQRIGFHLLQRPADELQLLADLFGKLKTSIRLCRICGAWTEEDPCWVCKDSSRDGAMVCVVGGMSELLALERSGTYKGLYHVLQGLLSPLDGRGPEELRIEPLMNRVQGGKLREVILALDPTIEGEATAHYLALRLEGIDLRVSRIASGVPVGGDLEYVDDLTLSRSLIERKEFKTES